MIPSRNLLKNPLWRPEEVGLPIPDSPYAVSMTLPTWQSVIDYERRCPVLGAQLQSGYPRFRIANQIQALADRYQQNYAKKGESVWLYDTRHSVLNAAKFIHHQNEISVRIEEIDGLQVLFCPETALDSAKAYWQHAGEGISARLADAVSQGQLPARNLQAETQIKAILADRYETAPENIYLFRSGMGAISAAANCLNHTRQAPFIQYGFSYVDTLKWLKILDQRTHFFPMAQPQDIERVQSLCQDEKLSALFCEVPSNPGLQTPDISALSAILRQNQVPFLIDGTLACCGSLDLLSHCDIVAESLTKYFSGAGDVMGGALIINPESPFKAEVDAWFAAHPPVALYAKDAEVLLQNAGNVATRIKTINDNALQLAQYLQNHPAVAEVCYPFYRDRALYDSLRKPDAGYGGLLSFIINDDLLVADVFDHLEVSKGPNLGMDYTLSCPFTMLAHFDELDWAESCGVSPRLIRVAVGTEPIDELIARFDRAFSHLK